MKKNVTNEPLLYIAQPKIKRPESHMQSEFMSEQKREWQTKKKSRIKHGNDMSMTSFQNLSLEKKINYLVNMKSRQLQMKCKFKTKDKTYYGTVLERDETTVDIHLGRRKVTINIADLETINLIGL